MARPEAHYQRAEQAQILLTEAFEGLVKDKQASDDALLIAKALFALTEATLANARYARRLEEGAV